MLSTPDKTILSFQLRHVFDFGVHQGYKIKVALSGDENHTPEKVDFLSDRELPDKGQHKFEESVKNLTEEFKSRGSVEDTVRDFLTPTRQIAGSPQHNGEV